MTEVVAALIWDNGRFLACRRPEGKARALLWEFVGGKVEKGETPEEALVRECMEELNIRVTVGDVFMAVTHRYPDIQIRLTVFHASIVSGAPQCVEHSELRWVTPEETRDMAFCPADDDILLRIRNEVPRGSGKNV